MWKVVINSNLNPPLKLFFYSSVLTNNNLLLKIYCKNIVVIFFNQNFLFFILFFFLSFHFHPSFISLFLFSFSCFSPPHKTHSPPSFYFHFHLKNIPELHMREREREREREIGLGLHRMHLHRRSSISTAARCPPHQSAWVRSTCSFFLFLFSYLLVLIQLYFKNWILFCVLCLDYVRNGENERKKISGGERKN